MVSNTKKNYLLEDNPSKNKRVFDRFLEYDIYDSTYVDLMLDNDEMSQDEAGFMKGYDEYS
ncbi:MAG: hypothetical protein ACQESC_01320 [Nanobdellota archaeon]